MKTANPALRPSNLPARVRIVVKVDETPAAAIAKGLSFDGEKWSGDAPGVGAREKFRSAVVHLHNSLGAPHAIHAGAAASGLRLHNAISVAKDAPGPGVHKYDLSSHDGAAGAKGLRSHLRRGGFKVGATSSVTSNDGATTHHFATTDRHGEEHHFSIATHAAPKTLGLPESSRKPVTSVTRATPGSFDLKPHRTLGEAPRRSLFGAKGRVRIHGFKAKSGARTANPVPTPASPTPTPSVTPSSPPATHNMTPTPHLMGTLGEAHGLTHVASLAPRTVHGWGRVRTPAAGASSRGSAGVGANGATQQSHFFTHAQPKAKMEQLRTSLSATHHVSEISQRRVNVSGGAARNEYHFSARPKTPSAGGSEEHSFHAVRPYAAAGVP